MAQTKTQIQAILAEAQTQPRHRFGQNFMIDGNLVRIIADAGEISADDLIIEVGPGTGTLTEELLARGAQVVAVEIDRDLAQSLRTRLADHQNFRLIEGDALSNKHTLCPELTEVLRANSHRKRKLIANLPYNIASPLVIELLIEGLDLLVFTVQKEVGDRLRATASSDDYGPLTVVVQMLAEVEVLRTLPSQAFWPAPKISSALVKVIAKNRLGNDAAEFGRFVHQLLSSRRKTIRKALMQADYDADVLLADLGIDPQIRSETLAPEQVHRLFVRVKNKPIV